MPQMGTHAGLVCVLALLATPAAAQSTEDAVRAMLHGDYETATRILRPLADEAARPDPVAQFFLAVLDDAGNGGISARACGLFLRAAARPNPFSEQAAALASAIGEEAGDVAPLVCVAKERWRGGPPQSFVLGPDHLIVFADTGIRVRYGDREQETNLILPPGAAFLPIQYTPLAVTRPMVGRRHFFQWFAWTPDTTIDPSAWTLSWTLSEVVDDRWVVIAQAPRLAVAGGPARPPPSDTLDLVRLQVNASGEAAFTIVGGTVPRTDAIPWRSADVVAPLPRPGADRVGPSHVLLQPGTVEGVAALVREDYQHAVEFLRPIAEDDGPGADAAAQFFMAGLYTAGLGVPVDPLRACALYLRAAVRRDTPFGREADRLIRASVARGVEFFQECHSVANVGLNSGFEPVTFDLGSGHWVDWTLTAATVTFDGRTRRVPVPLEVPGARFLPLRYTRLDTGPTRAVARDFVEAFVWQPSRPSGQWTLTWFVFEVVRDDIITVGVAESLATAAGDAPPPRESFEASDHAVLRVDDEGNAEMAVLKGPQARTQRIESDAERREVREEALARRAALESVDWTRHYDANRQPTMAYVDADGCGDVQVYGWSAARAEAIVVRAAGPALALSNQPVTFDLSRESVNLSVEAYVYAGAQGRFDFCSDVRMPPAPDSAGPGTWRAIAGTVTIALSPPGIRARSPYLNRATVTLRNVVLRNTAGTTVTIAGPVTLTAAVGSIAG